MAFRYWQKSNDLNLNIVIKKDFIQRAVKFLGLRIDETLTWKITVKNFQNSAFRF